MKFAPFRPYPSSALLAALSLQCAPGANAQAVYTVGSGGTHSSIQAAVNACPSTGCVIQLTETDYALPREIWIGNKDNLAIEAAPALKLAGIKPRLHSDTNLFEPAGTAADSTDPLRPAGWRRWPIKGSSSTTPGSAGDATNPYSTTGHQYNGLIVVDSSRDVRIEGLRIDGITPKHFVNVAVWSDKYDLLFGSVGVNLMRSRNAIVRDCEIGNFFAAMYINGRNRGGLLAPPDSSEGAPRHLAGTNIGAMGDHLIEGNTLHDNWWAVFDESEWDLGSTIRFNRCIGNRNLRIAEVVASSDQGNNMAGGFLYVQDVPLAIHRIHNNTIWGSPLVIGYGWTNYGAQHMFYNNIVGGFDRLDSKLRPFVNDPRQLLTYHKDWLENNLFEIGAADSLYQFQNIPGDYLADTAACATNGQASPCWLHWDAPVKVMTNINPMWLWNGWQVKQAGTYVATYNGTPYTITNSQAIEQFPGGGLVEKAQGHGPAMQDISSARNRWVKILSWESLDSSKANLLAPVWSDEQVQRVVKGQGRAASGWESGVPDLGATPSSGARPVIHGIRSQLPPFPKGGSCWEIPLVLDFQSTGGAITSVSAWSVPSESDAASIPVAPKPLTVLAITDSSLSNPFVKICFTPTTFEPNAFIRFQIESTAKLRNGATVSQEPAYFLTGTSTSTGTSAHSTGKAGLRLSRLPHALVASGLSEGDARMTLRTLDGRVLREIAFSTRAGALSFDVRGLPRGPVVVQVRQGDISWQSLTSLF